MNSSRLKKLQMAITLLAFLKENAAVMQNIPNSAALIAELENIIKLIQEHDLQQIDTSYLTKKKNDLRAVLNEQMELVSNRMLVFAEDNNDHKLISLVKYTPSEIGRFTDEEISQESASLFDIVQTNLPKLSAYLLDETTQTKFGNARTGFVAILPDNKREIQSQKDVKGKVDDDFDNLDAVIGKLDKRVNMVSTEYPVFYTDYYGLRKVTVTKSQQAIIAEIVDALTGLVLPNVLVIFSLNGVEKLRKLTSKQGGFWVASIEPGIYTIEVTKIGYETLKQTITITGDETYYLNLQLKKL